MEEKTSATEMLINSQALSQQTGSGEIIEKTKMFPSFLFCAPNNIHQSSHFLNHKIIHQEDGFSLSGIRINNVKFSAKSKEL